MSQKAFLLLSQPQDAPSPHCLPSSITRPNTMLTTRRTTSWSRRGTLSDAISLLLVHYVGYRRTPVTTLPCRFLPGSRHNLQATRFEHRVDEPTVKLHNRPSHIGTIGVPGSGAVSAAVPLRTCGLVTRTNSRTKLYLLSLQMTCEGSCLEFGQAF